MVGTLTISTVFFRNPDNTLSPMMGSSRIYYFIQEDQQKVRPFPKGLRMISGNQHGRNASSYQSLGVQMSCAGHERGKFLPNSTSYPNGCGALSLGIFFPSCGLADGSIDSDDHL